MLHHHNSSMGLAEAAVHVAALSAATWLLTRMRAGQALSVIADRAPAMGRRAERAAARSVDRLRREVMRLGPETAAPAEGAP